MTSSVNKQVSYCTQTTLHGGLNVSGRWCCAPNVVIVRKLDALIFFTRCLNSVIAALWILGMQARWVNKWQSCGYVTLYLESETGNNSVRNNDVWAIECVHSTTILSSIHDLKMSPNTSVCIVTELLVINFILHCIDCDVQRMRQISCKCWSARLPC